MNGKATSAACAAAALVVAAGAGAAEIRFEAGEDLYLATPGATISVPLYFVETIDPSTETSIFAGTDVGVLGAETEVATNPTGNLPDISDIAGFTIAAGRLTRSSCGRIS